MINPEEINNIFKNFCSQDKNEVMLAHNALASMIGPMVDQILSEAGTHKKIYSYLDNPILRNIKNEDINAEVS